MSNTAWPLNIYPKISSWELTLCNIRSIAGYGRNANHGLWRLNFRTAGRLTFLHSLGGSLLPSAFDAFCTKVSEIHHYKTRSAANKSYYLTKLTRTNDGKFDTRFQRPKIWNSIDG